MDVVEFPIKVDMAPAGNLLGSEGFGKAGVTVDEVKGRESYSVSFSAGASMELPSSYLVYNRTSNASESASRVKSAETEFHKASVQPLNVNSAHGNGLNSLAEFPGTEGVQSQRKLEKMVGSGGSCSKKLWTSPLVEFVGSKGKEVLKGRPEKLGARATKLMSPEQRLLLKQKNKRGGWKSSNFHTKAKFDSSSQKSCSTSFQSASGGKNFFGLYGLKSENQDISEHIDDIPLNELLSGIYNCPSLCKDNGENGSKTNGSFFSSVRKACSLLQEQKSTQIQNSSEMDDSVCQLTSVPLVDGGVVDDKQQSCRVAVSSDRKASCSMTVTPSLLDWPLHPPKEVLEHLALPPPRDLESLLLDATKPSASARTNDSRSSKKIARRSILPAFTWSHIFTGHCRANSDSVKLPTTTSRSICQGRWAKILNVTSCVVVAGGGFSNLDLLIFDRSLVPSKGIRIPSSWYKVFPFGYVTRPISPRQTRAILSNDPQGTLDTSQANSGKNGVTDEFNPRIVAAAQILCDIANHSVCPRTNGMLKSQKKCPQKTVKASNPKPDYKYEETLKTSIVLNGSEHVRREEQVVAAKKPRLMTSENRANPLFSGDKKGAVNWPVSRSSRSIHGKVASESNSKDKRSISSAHKQSFTMQSAEKDLNKASDGRRKLGKLILMDWKEGRDHWR